MSRKRRVLVIEQYATPRDQGGGTRHVDLYGRLENWETRFVISDYAHTTHDRIKTDDSRFILVPGLPYRGNGPARILGWVVFMIQAFFVGLRRKPDVVVGSSPQILSPVAALFVSKIRRIPFIMEVRDLWPESIVGTGRLKQGSFLHRLLVGLESWLYRNADQIIVVTEGWEPHMAELGIDTSKMVVIPNGADLSEFVVPESREEVRKEFNINGYTAIYAGSHGPMNSIERLVDAAEQLPEVNFLLIGDGPTKQQDIEEATRRGLTNIEFREPLPKSELPRLLKACDLGIHCIAPMDVLNTGMSPNKLFDYLAAGLPAVSNAKEGLTKVSEVGDLGVFGGPDDIADCIREVRASTPETLASWQTNAINLLQDGKYSRNHAAKTLEATLDKSYEDR